MRYLGVLVGVLLVAAGVFALRLAWFSQTAPAAVMIGLGCGLLGHHLGIILKEGALKKDPALARQVEIEQRDERNIRLNHGAKSKAFDNMSLLQAVVVLVLVLINTDMAVVLILVGAYVFSYISMFYHWHKLNKEL